MDGGKILLEVNVLLTLINFLLFAAITWDLVSDPGKFKMCVIFRCNRHSLGIKKKFLVDHPPKIP